MRAIDRSQAPAPQLKTRDQPAHCRDCGNIQPDEIRRHVVHVTDDAIGNVASTTSWSEGWIELSDGRVLTVCGDDPDAALG